MKRFILLISLSAMALFTHSATAEGMYFGVKGGVFQYKEQTGVETKSPINIGVFFGADVFNIGSSIVAVEADINTSAVKGEYNVTGFGDFDLNQQTSAIYMALRTDQEDFFKAKVGYHATTFTIGDNDPADSSALSYGIGFGVAGYEVEYTIFAPETSDGDNFSMISVGYRFM